MDEAIEGDEDQEHDQDGHDHLVNQLSRSMVFPFCEKQQKQQSQKQQSPARKRAEILCKLTTLLVERDIMLCLLLKEIFC